MNDQLDLAIELFRSTKWPQLFKQINASSSRGMSGWFGDVKLLTYCCAGRIILTFTYFDRYVNLIADESDVTRIGLRDTPLNVDVAIKAIQMVIAFDGNLVDDKDVYYL